MFVELVFDVTQPVAKCPGGTVRS